MPLEYPCCAIWSRVRLFGKIDIAKVITTKVHQFRQKHAVASGSPILSNELNWEGFPRQINQKYVLLWPLKKLREEKSSSLESFAENLVTLPQPDVLKIFKQMKSTRTRCTFQLGSSPEELACYRNQFDKQFTRLEGQPHKDNLVVSSVKNCPFAVKPRDLLKAIERCGNGKVSGISGIPVELLKPIKFELGRPLALYLVNVRLSGSLL